MGAYILGFISGVLVCSILAEIAILLGAYIADDMEQTKNDISSR